MNFPDPSERKVPPAMHIVIDASAPRLEDLEDTARFKVVAPATADLTRILRSHGWGTYDGSHAWVSIRAIREAARGRVAPDWDERFGRMVDVAGEHGWLDPGRSAIRCHVELMAADSRPST